MQITGKDKKLDCMCERMEGIWSMFISCIRSYCCVYRFENGSCSPIKLVSSI